MAKSTLNKKELANALNNIDLPVLKNYTKIREINFVFENSKTYVKNLNDQIEKLKNEPSGKISKVSNDLWGLLDNLSKKTTSTEMKDLTTMCENAAKLLTALSKCFGGVFSSKESKDLKKAIEVHAAYFVYCRKALLPQSVPLTKAGVESGESYRSLKEKRDDFLANLEALTRASKTCKTALNEFKKNVDDESVTAKECLEYFKKIPKLFKNYLNLCGTNLTKRLRKSEGDTASQKILNHLSMTYLLQPEDTNKLTLCWKNMQKAAQNEELSGESLEALRVGAQWLADSFNLYSPMKYCKNNWVSRFNRKAVLNDKRIKSKMLQLFEIIKSLMDNLLNSVTGWKNKFEKGEKDEKARERDFLERYSEFKEFAEKCLNEGKTLLSKAPPIDFDERQECLLNLTHALIAAANVLGAGIIGVDRVLPNQFDGFSKKYKECQVSSEHKFTLKKGQEAFKELNESVKSIKTTYDSLINNGTRYPCTVEHIDGCCTFYIGSDNPGNTLTEFNSLHGSLLKEVQTDGEKKKPSTIPDGKLWAFDSEAEKLYNALKEFKFGNGQAKNSLKLIWRNSNNEITSWN